MNNDFFLTADSLPEETALCEPSKLQQFAIINLWGYWRKRQALGLQGLAFKTAHAKDIRDVSNNNRKGKGRALYVDVHTPSRTPSPAPSETVLSLPRDQNGAGPSGQRHSPPQSQVGTSQSLVLDQHTQPCPTSLVDTQSSASTTRSQATEQEEVTPDPNSPLHHSSTKKGRFLFLKSLSQEEVYMQILKSMTRIRVSGDHYAATCHPNGSSP
jgi:hypothetical protein